MKTTKTAVAKQHAGHDLYDVTYSDSCECDKNLRYAALRRIASLGYTVIVSQPDGDHTIPALEQ